MGFGDEIMATGMARGARARGKRIAFGDGRKIMWGPWSKPIFQGNPNVAPPGSEGAADLEWVAHYVGSRLYNRPGGKGWIWNYGFRPTPGEIFFNEGERALAASHRSGFILIEPNAPEKPVAPNKQWPADRWEAVVRSLIGRGRHDVVQLDHPGTRQRLPGVSYVATSSFRDALAVLSRARLFLGHEGGMHHGSAALGIPAVVICGGFVPPAVTGYDTHINLAAGGEACGSTSPCSHCRAALEAITVDHVLDSANRLLDAGNTS